MLTFKRFTLMKSSNAMEMEYGQQKPWKLHDIQEVELKRRYASRAAITAQQY